MVTYIRRTYPWHLLIFCTLRWNWCYFLLDTCTTVLPWTSCKKRQSLIFLPFAFSMFHESKCASHQNLKTLINYKLVTQ
jgi:hypothetical protein